MVTNGTHSSTARLDVPVPAAANCAPMTIECLLAMADKIPNLKVEARSIEFERAHVMLAIRVVIAIEGGKARGGLKGEQLLHVLRRVLRKIDCGLKGV